MTKSKRGASRGEVPPEALSESSTEMWQSDERDRATRVRSRHEERLMCMEGVVSIGIGSDESGRTAIVVGVSHVRAAAVRMLPRSLEGFPLVVRKIGHLSAEDH